MIDYTENTSADLERQTRNLAWLAYGSLATCLYGAASIVALWHTF